MYSLLESNNLKFFTLFIHEKEQFWPKADMEQQEQFTIIPNKSIVVSFKPKLQIKLMNDEKKCIDDETYSLTKCLEEFFH